MAPSRFINPSSLNYCRPIKRHEIDKVIGQFGDAADVAVAAGFDAIELHFGHLYLPSSFLSPKMNRRKDEYGGSIDNRSRFVRQIAQRVREVVGDRIAVTAKMNMVDGIRGGIWLGESIRTAQLLDQDGNLDAIELTEGSSVTKPMYLFRVTCWSTSSPGAASATAIRPANDRQGALGDYPYRNLYMLDNARQFVPRSEEHR